MHRLLLRRAFLAASLALVLGFLPSAAKAQFKVIRLDANVSGVGAMHIDPNLANAWGIAFSPTGTFWISDEATGLSTLYDGKGVIQSLVVTIPSASGTGLGSPTGMIFNSTTGFKVTKGTKSGAALFIFDSLDGTISGWSPSVDATHAIVAVNNSSIGASYTGLAFATNGSGENFLFAADSSFNDRVDIYDSSFHLVKSVSDSTIPPNFTPYGAQNINGQVYISFADPSGSPGGYIDIFDADGNFIKRFASNGALSQPWGMALAPATYSKFGGALLVSNNLTNGTINAFDLSTGASLGPLQDLNHKTIVINQLWGIAFGAGNILNGKTNELFFTAGPNNYTNGAFGVIEP